MGITSTYCTDPVSICPQKIRQIYRFLIGFLRMGFFVCSNGMNGTVGFFRSLNVDDVEAIFRASF